MYPQYNQRHPNAAESVWAEEAGLAIAMHESLCVSLWRGEATMARLDLQDAAFADITDRFPKRSLVLCVLEPGRPPPAHYLRRRIFAMLNYYAPHFEGFACVVEGSGFTASINRAVFGSIEALGGGFQFPMHYCATYRHGISWLKRKRNLDSDKISSVVDYMRERMPAYV